jgi:hypothetical protein
MGVLRAVTKVATGMYLDTVVDGLTVGVNTKHDQGESQAYGKE